MSDPSTFDSSRSRLKKTTIPADIRALASEDAFRGPGNLAGRVDVSPSATVIDEQRPWFKWSGAAADDYEIALYQGDDEIAHSGRQRGTSWLCPRTLDRG